MEIYFWYRYQPKFHESLSLVRRYNSQNASHPDEEAKYWMSPELALATSTGLSQKQINEAQRLVLVHMEEITHAWHIHFPS